MKLNILVLHNLGDPRFWRDAMVEKEFCLPLFADGNNYCVQDCVMPLREYLREISFDAIVLTQTFLSKRQDPRRLRRIMEEYAFVKDSSAFKIALPQDDYTCSAILDRWMVDWQIDIVYPACVNDWDVLYPTYSRKGKLLQGYTGYISDKLIERTRTIKPVESRRIDVSYRAALLSPQFGRMGLIKSEISQRFAQRAAGKDLNLDLSTETRDAILGSRWYDFIEASKCMIGVNSGASLLDREGKVNFAVHRYLQRNPKASFEEVEAACFPGLDGVHTFTAISPRNYESALLGTVQLLTPGPYGGFIRPWEHYVPLEPDISNFDEVLQVIKDPKHLERIATACREQILSFPELRYDNHVADLISQIRQKTKISDTERAASVPLIKRHREEMSVFEPVFWRNERLKRKVHKALADMGARRVKYLVMDILGKG